MEKQICGCAPLYIKTKLQCDAPDPSARELAIFREAVLQRVGELENMPTNEEGNLPVEAMLPLRPRQPVPTCLPGDVGPVEASADELTTANDKHEECTREKLPGQPGMFAFGWTAAAAASVLGVANEFSEGDSRPCAKVSPRTPCWLGSIDNNGTDVSYSVRVTCQVHPC